jgi:hypothetical protein
MNTDYARRTQFHRWWSKNHNRSSAHSWLVLSTVAWLKLSLSAPELQHQAQLLHKRFFNSEYRKLSAPDAYKLWRWSHPGVQRRTAQLYELTNIRQQQQNSVHQKPTHTPHIHYKPKRKLIADK